MAKKRLLSAATRGATLAAAKACRTAAVQLLTEAPIHSAEYQRAAELLDAIDALAEALTGKAELFHTKPHTAGG